MMKRILPAVAIAVLALPIHAADQAQADRPAPYQVLNGRYAIYSGELGDQQAPTKGDRKLSLIIEGKPAQDIFDSMAPDDKNACGDEGARSRTKGNAWCTYQPHRGHKCYLGLDLRTGKSIGGGMC
jgi:hypothetical protein